MITQRIKNLLKQLNVRELRENYVWVSNSSGI